jgi:hypothetical protein
MIIGSVQAAVSKMLLGRICSQLVEIARCIVFALTRSVFARMPVGGITRYANTMALNRTCG